METLVTVLIAVVGIPAALVGYIYLSEGLIRLLGGEGGKGRPVFGKALTASVRHWLWILPAVVLLAVFLVYPTIHTVWLSFQNGDSTQPVGWANYVEIFTDPAMLGVLWNNIVWLVGFTAGALLFGLVIAVLSDRVPYEVAAKTMIFVPMAISFVAAGIIWSLVFAYNPAGEKQVGLLNAMLVTVNPSAEPQAWLTNTGTNTLALIAVGVWMWAGFSMVTLSAGLKGIPMELLEAARVDGAKEGDVFLRITLPLLGPTIAVVAMTLVMNVLKIFDIVYIMTNGNFGTEVIANRMYKEMFNYNDFGVAGALAVVLMVFMVPFMVIKVRSEIAGRK